MSEKKITLKRSLFIGLGGTGADAILHTKKRFLDTFGEVPPMVGFLVLDTDRNTESKSINRENVLKVHKDQNTQVKLLPSEFIFEEVIGAVEVYNHYRDNLFSWLSSKNVHTLRNLNIGAGQVRTNGRFGVFAKHSDIVKAVKNKVVEILSIKINDNPFFQPKSDDVEINFVFSIAGGTGSGSFVDVAYLVGNQLKGHKTNNTAFIVFPDVFNAMQSGIAMANTNPNSYGALCELDYFMENDIEGKKLVFDYQDVKIPIKNNPFDLVFTINNKNSSGETINQIDAISEQIGLALFTGASELSNNVDSIYDNIKAVLAGGGLDIGNKRAWASGMGSSELFYDGNLLGNVYSRKVQITMIRSLKNTNEDAQKFADEFIDDPEVDIRENNGDENNRLIDQLLSDTPNYLFPGVGNTPDDYKNEVNAYLKNIEEIGKKDVSQNYNKVLNKVPLQLRKKVKNHINSKNGVGNTLIFLNELKIQIGEFNGDMVSERQGKKQEQEDLRIQIDSTIDELRNLTSSSILKIVKKAEINNLKSSLGDLVNHSAKIIFELFRREYAEKFFTKLLQDINDYIDKVKVISQKLDNVEKTAFDEANRLANDINNQEKLFVIDLHKNDLNSTYANDDDFIITEFIKTLDGNLPGKILGFADISEEVIDNYFWNYAKDLKKAKDYVNKSIDDVVNKMSQENQVNLAKRLLQKSKTLWQTNTFGYVLGNNIFDCFVIGLPDLNSSFKKAFDNLIDAGGQNIIFVGTGVKNKVTCYRMEAAVPIFAVGGVKLYEDDYKIRKANPNSLSYFVDQQIETKIEREDFSIWPAKQEDNTLSLWVLGLVYEQIRFNNEKDYYEVYSLKKGDPIKGYWYKLDKYRDTAFSAFKKDGLPTEVEEQIRIKEAENGSQATKDLLMNVKKNYKEKYAQMNISEDDLDKPHFSNIRKLFADEIDFVTKTLQP